MVKHVICSKNALKNSKLRVNFFQQFSDVKWGKNWFHSIVVHANGNINKKILFDFVEIYGSNLNYTHFHLQTYSYFMKISIYS